MKCRPRAYQMTPEQAPCECKKREEKVQAHGYCPTYQMASVPVLTAETIVDFDPENTCAKYVNTLVVDPKNGRTFFYDVFGIMTEIKTDKQAKDLIKKLKDEKQNAIKNHNPEVGYRENDIVVFDGKLYQALQDIKGEFNSANWRVLDGTTGALPQYETITEPKTTYAPNKLLITPTGDVSFSTIDGEVKPIKQKEEIAKTKTNIETNRYKELITFKQLTTGDNAFGGVINLDVDGTVSTIFADIHINISTSDRDFTVNNLTTGLIELSGSTPADIQFYVTKVDKRISLAVSSRNQHEVKSNIASIVSNDLTVLRPKKEAQTLETGIKQAVSLTIE